MLELPTDHPRPALQSYRGARRRRYCRGSWRRAEGTQPAGGATLFMTLLAAFQVLLARYSGRRTLPSGRRSRAGTTRNWKG